MQAKFHQTHGRVTALAVLDRGFIEPARSNTGIKVGKRPKIRIAMVFCIKNKNH
jgi:hypothetical protein